LGTEKALGLKRQEIGIRLPDYSVPLSLINALGCPLYGVTAKREMLLTEEFDQDSTDEETLFDGGWELEDIPGLCLVLDPGEDRKRIFSTVLDLSSGEIQVLRQGAGHWPV
jgi:tRNA A37 threonylcarbamoyladenosine synthetase subunit TsaC/SUA5/YrdC